MISKKLSLNSYALHGVIDSTDFRLMYQGQRFGSNQVKKITGHISKKVSDKLNELFKKDREGFEKKWKTLACLWYGLISDEKFFERSQRLVWWRTRKEVVRLSKNGKKPYLKFTKTKMIKSFSSHQQSWGPAYLCRINKIKDLQMLLMDVTVDNHFVQHLEMKDGVYLQTSRCRCAR